MKNVMTRAWSIAKKGKEQFGGNVRDYFSQALVIAWAEYKTKQAQLAAIKAKGLEIYKNYIKTVISKGATLVSDKGTDIVLSVPHKNYTIEMVVSYEMSGFDVFAKVTQGKQVKHFNIGSAM